MLERFHVWFCEITICLFSSLYVAGTLLYNSYIGLFYIRASSLQVCCYGAMILTNWGKTNGASAVRFKNLIND